VKPSALTPDYLHKVVDCQWACPAHTPVPEYVRLIAAGAHAEAYLVNWRSNVFPGILGRVCDRPCEPACRRDRVDGEPVAICRLKRVAADLKGDIRDHLPKPPELGNGRRIACVGAGPASMTVARDLALRGYAVTVFDGSPRAGGMMRSEIPAFRLPTSVIDEECGHIEALGVAFRSNSWVGSLEALLTEGWDAVFVGTGAPRGRDIDLPGRSEASAHIHVGIDWLSSVAFGHVERAARRVIVLGGGNTAMDCSRTARRLGAEAVHVIVRSAFEEMKASPWEREEAMHEGITIRNMMVPLAFTQEQGRLTGMLFGKVRAEYDACGRRSLVPTGEAAEHVACDEVLVAIGQENSFPWIERDIGIDFDDWGMPVLDRGTLQSTRPEVFFGGDAALGPKNIITAVAQGHEAAISIDRFCSGLPVAERPAPRATLTSQKMGIHAWSYSNRISESPTVGTLTVGLSETLKSLKLEFELGFDAVLACGEAERCLNCDVATVFTPPACIECDACVDICPAECITFIQDGDEEGLRTRLKAPAPNTDQALYIANGLKTGRFMVKDEDVCLHCGMCAERCPTGAWDMQKFALDNDHANAEAMPA